MSALVCTGQSAPLLGNGRQADSELVGEIAPHGAVLSIGYAEVREVVVIVGDRAATYRAGARVRLEISSYLLASEAGHVTSIGE